MARTISAPPEGWRERVRTDDMMIGYIMRRLEDNGVDSIGYSKIRSILSYAHDYSGLKLSDHKVSAKVDVVNISPLKELLDIFKDVLEDERIPEDVRMEYLLIYNGIEWEGDTNATEV